MAVALVGEKNADGGYGPSTTLSYSSTLGNTLILYVASNGANTVSDNAGNVWTLAGDTASAGATAQRVGQVYYTVDADPITSVTVTRTGSTNWSIKMTEWSGVSAFGSSDTKSAPTAPSVTAAADDMVIAGAFYYTGSPAFTSGYEVLPAAGQRPNFNIAVQYRAAAAAGAAAPTFGLASSGLVTLRLVPSAPPAPQSHFRLVGSNWVPVSVQIARST